MNNLIFPKPIRPLNKSPGIADSFISTSPCQIRGLCALCTLYVRSLSAYNVEEQRINNNSNQFNLKTNLLWQY